MSVSPPTYAPIFAVLAMIFAVCAIVVLTLLVHEVRDRLLLRAGACTSQKQLPSFGPWQLTFGFLVFVYACFLCYVNAATAISMS